LEYVGTVHYEPALKVLAAAAAEPDETVARGAINGLGADGSRSAIAALVSLLKDGKRRGRHLLIAQNLARTQSPEALRELQALAGKNHLPALYALAEAAPPSCFAFFEELAAREKNPDRRALALRGLRCADPDRAGPILLKLLTSDEVAPAPGTRSAEVDELIALSSPRLVPDLTRLAVQGNLRALQALAGYRDESAIAPLQERARNAGPPEQALLALQGLVRNWPKPSVAIFKEGLASKNPDRLALSAEGLARGRDPEAASLLLKLLHHPDAQVRSSVAASLARLPAETAAPRWVEGLLATDDDQVALVLVNALIQAQWKDRTSLPRLGDKLKAGKGDMAYQIIRLLRHVAGEPMGPATYFEYADKADTWVGKWSEWLARQ
jgi:HEAT repeat protein